MLGDSRKWSVNRYWKNRPASGDEVLVLYPVRIPIVFSPALALGADANIIAAAKASAVFLILMIQTDKMIIDKVSYNFIDNKKNSNFALDFAV